ncbi:outer membrane protein [Asaia krungthepensis NRIC 0535]|uniref:Outer membrane protein n=1 Tax=Asaia krungthepensis NRIC 0535 TaxID=1307925 RepID=A0ABQ0Q3Q2_9PROT|nr:outer membrane protein [Asaia krungthepensis NRIC 0535]
MSSGGTLIFNDNTTNRGIIELDGNGATIVVNGTQMPAGPITGWSANDKIILKGIPRSSIVRAYVGTAGVTFYTKDGNSYTVPIIAASSKGYSITQDENGNAVFLTCFAEGTLIRTPMGEVAVERLCEGQLVDTPKGPMPVKWIGHRTLEVLKQPEPEDCWLVRIRKDALGDNIPARDLLVTQEHCMVFDGQLVPARMLVNDQSIYLDRSLTQYRYFHVELDQHEAIWAEGALTESYLDTGNREQFANAPLTILSPQFCASGSSTLPLETSRDFVEPIYEALLARIGRSMEKPVLSHDPKLHLCTEDGRVIQPARVGPAGYVFMIPDSVASVRLMSKTGCPSAVIGPYVDDRRELGVAVEEISLFSTSGMQALDTIFDTPVIEGWHAPEGARHRWTNGAAHLALGADRTQRVLNIRLAAVGPYAETATASSGPVPSAITCANENARGTTALQRRMSV